MEIERDEDVAQEQTDIDIEPREPRGRGGSLAGIAAALGRPAPGAGLAHWGGPLPRRSPTTPSAMECEPKIDGA